MKKANASLLLFFVLALDFTWATDFFVTKINKDGAAGKSGLLRCDILERVDDRVFDSTDAFLDYISEKNTVRVSIIRGEKPMSLVINPHGFSFIEYENKPQVNIATGSNQGGIAYSPDGKYFLIGSCLWEAETGRELRNFGGGLQAEDISPDGRYALFSSGDSAFMFDIDSGCEVQSFVGHANTCNSASFSADGRMVVTASSDKTIKVWDIDDGKEIRTIDGHGSLVMSAKFSPDGKRIASGSYDKSVKLWDVSTGECVGTNGDYSNGVFSVGFSADGKFLVTGSGDGSVKILDAKNCRLVRGFAGHAKPVRSVSFSPDGKRIISSSDDGTIKLWEAGTGELSWTFSADASPVYSCAFSPDGRRLLSTMGIQGLIWDIDTGTILRRISGDAKFISSIAVSADGKYAASGSWDNSVLLWDLSTGKGIRAFTGSKDKISSVAITPDSKYLISGSFDNSIKLFSIDTGKLVREFNGHVNGVQILAISPDGKRLASGDFENNVFIWDIASGKIQKKIAITKGADRYENGVSSVAFSPDGKTLAVGAGTLVDGSLTLWNVSSGREKKTICLDCTSVVAFSKDGRFVLGAHSTELVMYNSATGEKIRTYSARGCRAISAVAFSEDGSRIIVGETGDLFMWETDTGILLKTFYGHTNRVCSVAFTPDQKQIFSGSWDCTSRLWDASSGRELARFIKLVNNEWVVMTPDSYFNTSANGAKAVNVVQGRHIYSIDNFFDSYFRPDIVTASIQMRDISAIATKSISQGIVLPPEVSIRVQERDGTYRGISVQGKQPWMIEDGHVNVQVTATDNGGGIKGVRLYNNGKVIAEGTRGISVEPAEKKGQYTFNARIELFDGINTVKAVGFSLDMTESNPASVEMEYRSGKKPKPNMYVLGIGINEYKNSKYDLNYCVSDAQGFIGALRQKAEKVFGNVDITTLIDGDATRDKVLGALEAIRQRAGVEDVFILYYAGHGISLDVPGDNRSDAEFFYVLRDVTQMSDHAKVVSEGISGAEIQKELTGIKANKQIMFVDACNSGALAMQFTERGAAEENALAKLSRATGSVILASTTKDQFASEFEELKHGAFTYVVIEGLMGAAALPNGQITAAGLKAFIDDQIPYITQKYKGDAQYPTTFLWGNDFPIGLR